jgi:hypothetical protein
MAKKIGVEALARILFSTVEACYEKCDHTYRVDMPLELVGRLRGNVEIPDREKESEFYHLGDPRLRNMYRDVARSIISGISYNEIVDARARAKAKSAKRKKSKKKG